MERRGSNTWLVAALAIAVGFLGALLILGGDDDADTTNATVEATTTSTTTTGTTTNGTTATTTTGTTPEAAPATPQASVGSCIDLWNQTNNRAAQTFMVNIASQQPVRVHVGTTSDVPPECLITVIANNGDAFTFAEGGGASFPFAPTPGRTSGAELPEAQKTANALEQRDGTLTAR